jgi:hypothetical protein
MSPPNCTIANQNIKASEEVTKRGPRTDVSSPTLSFL